MKTSATLLLALTLSLTTAGLTANARAQSCALTPVVGSAGSTAYYETVNINTADVQALTKLKGIGPKKAEAIVAWRSANGNFKTLDQLLEVKGIGPKILEANRELLCL